MQSKFFPFLHLSADDPAKSAIYFPCKTDCMVLVCRKTDFKPVSKPLNSENILEHCRKWSASRIILFLEFPWVLTHFDITITLSSEELASFAKMRLSLANKVDTGERSVLVRKIMSVVFIINKLNRIVSVCFAQLSRKNVYD